MDKEATRKLQMWDVAIAALRDGMEAIRRRHDTGEAFQEILVAEIQKSHPRVKSSKTAEKLARQQKVSEDVTLYDSLYEAYTNEVVARYETMYTETKKLRQKRDEFLLTQEPVPSEDSWYTVDSVWVSTYRTQGWGARTYAQRMAELRLEGYQNGSPTLEMRMRYQEEPLEDFILEARVASKVDAEIVRLRYKSQGLRDVVKRCWARGVNPRVYLPGLDPDFETKQGLDYFGNDVQKD